MFGSEPTMTWLFFRPSGRISRQVFGLGLLFWIMLLAWCISQMVLFEDDEQAFALWVLVLLLVSAVAILSTMMLAIKRLHDIGLSGFYVAVMLFPVAAAIGTPILMLWPSIAGPCRYGAATNRPRR